MNRRADDDALKREVAQVAILLDVSCRDPWWLIGSAALALCDADAPAPGDIDVLTSRRDADTFHAHHRHLVISGFAPADDRRFRSLFARFRFAPFAVELMGGLEIECDARWIAVTVNDDMMVDCDGVAVRLPTRCDQIRLFELFGRDKDLAKAQALRNRIALEALHAVLG